MGLDAASASFADLSIIYQTALCPYTYGGWGSPAEGKHNYIAAINAGASGPTITAYNTSLNFMVRG
jgi:hypothetical protein